MGRRRLLIAASWGTKHLFFFFCAVALTATTAGAAVHTVALRGGHPFGAENGATFDTFTTPALNNRGQVAFSGTLTGGGVTTADDSAHWIVGQGSIATVIREGSAAPGMPAGAVFGSETPTAFVGAPLNDAGEIAVSRGVILAGGGTSSGLWVGSGQSLNLVAAQGGVAPGAQNGASFAGFGLVRAALSDAGDVAFANNVSGPPYNTPDNSNYVDGAWVYRRDGSVTSAIQYESAATVEAGAQLFGFSNNATARPVVNRHGQAVFSGTHRLASGSIQSSVWSLANGNTEIVAYAQQPIPELGAGADLEFPLPPGLNNEGRLALRYSYREADEVPTKGSLIGTLHDDEFSIAIRNEMAAPGLSGYTFESFAYEASVGGGGHLAFYGNVWTEGAANRKSGIWAGRPNELQLVALEGESAPGTAGTFAGFARSTPAVNRFGQVAFMTAVNIVGTSQKNSLWATDVDGELKLIAMMGGTIEVAPGDVRTIQTVGMNTTHGDQDGRPRSLNDFGQIAFKATFTDGSGGIFLSDAVAHLPGDYNGDGLVDSADYVVWSKSTASQNLIADGTRDGVVNGEDIALIQEFFGMSLDVDFGGGAPVPEPGVAMIIGAIGFLLAWRRHGR